MDFRLLHALNRPGFAPLDAIMIALSSRWLLLPLLGAAALYLALRTPARWKGALLLVAAAGLSDALSARVIKPLVDRPRPCAIIPFVGERPAIGVQGCGRGQSMPSNHAANAAAAAATLGVLAPPLALPGAALALLIGVSRIYLGQHWPSDVLAGFAFGIALAALLVFGARRFGWLPKRAA